MARSPEQVDFQQLLDASEVQVDIVRLAAVDHGYSSTVFFTSEHAVKLLKEDFPTQRSARKFADVLYGEQEAIRQYIKPDNIAVAEFVVGSTCRGDHRVSLVQDRVRGLSIGEALSDRSAGIFGNYFADALEMYRKTRQIPDLACMERRFDPLVDPNTQVVTDGNTLRPVLIDTTYGRLQRRPYAGMPIRRGIAWGVQRALDAL